jgi:hypothetical protein
MDPKFFFAQVRSSFSDLVENRHFRLVREEYWPDVFGNALVVFMSENLSLQVSRDGGDIRVDVGPRFLGSENFFDVKSVIEFLGKNRPGDLQSLANAIDENYDEIGRFFVNGTAIASFRRRYLEFLKQHNKGKQFRHSL